MCSQVWEQSLTEMQSKRNASIVLNRTAICDVIPRHITSCSGNRSGCDSIMQRAYSSSGDSAKPCTSGLVNTAGHCCSMQARRRRRSGTCQLTTVLDNALPFANHENDQHGFWPYQVGTTRFYCLMTYCNQGRERALAF